MTAQEHFATVEPIEDGLTRSIIDQAWMPPIGTWSAEKALTEALAAFTAEPAR